MKTVYSSQHLFMVHHYKNILDARGIDCVVRNEHLSGAAGELPPTECWPMLYVADEHESKARQIIEEAMANEANTTHRWVCPSCGETIEGQFEWCWNCGSDPGTDA